MYKYFRFEMAALSTAWTRTLELVWGDWQKAPYYIAAAAFTSFALFLLGGVPVVTDYILVLGAAFLGAVMLFSTVFAWQLVTAPYKIWKRQQNEIESLNEVLIPKKTRVEIDVGNGDEFVQIRGTYMFKVTNNGEDSSTCLARLVRYTQDENEYVVNEVLPTKRQREGGAQRSLQSEQRRVKIHNADREFSGWLVLSVGRRHSWPASTRQSNNGGSSNSWLW